MSLLDYIKDERNAALSTTCKDLLVRFKTKQITRPEFDNEIAYLALPSLTELRYQYPIQQTVKVREYFDLDRKERKSLSKDKEISDWADIKLRRENENKANWTWLNDLWTRLSQDLDSQKKVITVMDTYPKDRFFKEV